MIPKMQQIMPIQYGSDSSWYHKLIRDRKIMLRTNTCISHSNDNYYSPLCLFDQKFVSEIRFELGGSQRDFNIAFTEEDRRKAKMKTSVSKPKIYILLRLVDLFHDLNIIKYLLIKRCKVMSTIWIILFKCFFFLIYLIFLYFIF